MRLLKRLLIRFVAASLAIVVVVAVISWWLLNRSLPVLDGELDVSGITAAVTIARDSAGIPVISADNRNDLAYATGFVHAQDRFFQMDLTRRKAAGELAEIIGGAAANLDKQVRLHRFRARAAEVLSTVTPHEARILSAYTAGVNDGLANLGSRPFEYWLLGEVPEPWSAIDSILVGYAMFMELNDERATRDIRRGLVHRSLPENVFDWLYQHGTEWDAPLMGDARAPLPVPGPTEFSVRKPTGSVMRTPQEIDAAYSDEVIVGSNNWAISGALTANGGALVANDMHLGITVPNVFYRARLRVTGDQARDLNGVTLPGVPVIVAGSNGHVAWGNTNSYGDWSDAVIVHAGKDPDSYVTPEGEQQFAVYHEQIKIKGEEPQTLVVRETIWGPVLEDHDDPELTLAVSWIAHHSAAINIRQLELETAKSVEQALRLANNFGMPPQNFVVGDSSGSIGWTIAGKIPRRGDYDSFLPADWSQEHGWQGWLSPDEYPRILDPESGRLWTANARVADDTALHLIGDGGYDLGARAKQIRDGLFAKEKFSPADLLEVQLDDRALFLERWQALLLQTLDEQSLANKSTRREFRDLVANWIPRAIPDAVGYRLVRRFRLQVRNRVFDMLMQPVRERFGEEIPLRISNQFEGPLWRLLEERPTHLLANDYADWDDLLLHSVDATIELLTENFSGGLAQRSWGERNTAAIRHPLSRFVPFLSGWLDMPRDTLPGDSNLPRAQGPAFGASERFGVSPGDEAKGYLHMPAGQSGHPLSDYYHRGHSDWVDGRFSPYLPGESRHTLIMTPAP